MLLGECRRTADICWVGKIQAPSGVPNLQSKGKVVQSGGRESPESGGLSVTGGIGKEVGRSVRGPDRLEGRVVQGAGRDCSGGRTMSLMI